MLPCSVATLEGIALLGDPDYQLVTQAYPFVVRKVLRNDNRGASRLLNELLFDSKVCKFKVWLPLLAVADCAHDNSKTHVSSLMCLHACASIRPAVYGCYRYEYESSLLLDVRHAGSSEGCTA